VENEDEHRPLGCEAKFQIEDAYARRKWYDDDDDNVARRVFVRCCGAERKKERARERRI
jgi:hypothetical protein